MDQLISSKTFNNRQKKRTCNIVDFAVLSNYRVKLKDNQKKDKYLHPVTELKKWWNMKVTVISIAIGTLGTVNKWLVK